MDDLPNIIDKLASSILPVDSLFCFCLALSKIDSFNPANIAQMIQLVKNDEDLKVYFYSSY